MAVRKLLNVSSKRGRNQRYHSFGNSQNSWSENVWLNHFIYAHQMQCGRISHGSCLFLKQSSYLINCAIHAHNHTDELHVIYILITTLLAKWNSFINWVEFIHHYFAGLFYKERFPTNLKYECTNSNSNHGDNSSSNINTSVTVFT